MSHFTPIDGLPVLDLHKELNNLLNDKKVHWNKTNSICINTIADEPDNYELGTGSLTYDWDNSYRITKDDGTVERIVPEIVSEKDDEDKMKSVAYQELVPILVESIKELKQEITNLKNELSILKK